jgi:hypothetical protein
MKLLRLTIISFGLILCWGSSFAGSLELSQADLEAQIRGIKDELFAVTLSDVSVKRTRRAFQRALDLYLEIPDQKKIIPGAKQRLLDDLATSIAANFHALTDGPGGWESGSPRSVPSGRSWLIRKASLWWNRFVQDFMGIPRTFPLLGKASKRAAKIAAFPKDFGRALARNVDRVDGKYSGAETANEIDAVKILAQKLQDFPPEKAGFGNAVVWMVWSGLALYCFLDPPFEPSLVRSTWSPLAGGILFGGLGALLARSRSIDSGLRFYKEMTAFGHELERLDAGKPPFGSIRRLLVRKIPMTCLWAIRRLSGKPMEPEIFNREKIRPR